MANNRSGKRAHDRGNAYCGAGRFLLYLRQSGLVPQVALALRPLETRLRAWMRQHRGVCELTLDSYGLVVKWLLDALGTEPRAYTAARLQTFVLVPSRGFSRSKDGNVITAVRAIAPYCCCLRAWACALATSAVCGWAISIGHGVGSG